MLRRLCAAGLALVLGCSQATNLAWAVNWEGHDDWFLNDAPFKEFTDTMPAPMKKVLPPCADMQAAHDANSYEQVPIAGVNCVVKKKAE
jgi:hypothetical protein